MRSLKVLVVALLSIVAFASCNKDKSAVLELDRTALYFTSWEDSAQSISYVATNAVSVAVGSCSTGWSARVDMVSQRIIVEPIGTQEEGMTNDDLSKEGSVVVNALNKDSEATSYYIYVYIARPKLLLPSLQPTVHRLGAIGSAPASQDSDAEGQAKGKSPGSRFRPYFERKWLGMPRRRSSENSA